MDNQYRVLQAGFCVSGKDDTQSASSVVNLMGNYIADHGYINVTRTI